MSEWVTSAVYVELGECECQSESSGESEYVQQGKCDGRGECDCSG